MKNVIIIGLLFIITACDYSNEAEKKSQEHQKLITNRESFEQNLERIRRENAEKEKQLVEQRSIVRAQFVSVDSNYIHVELKNLTENNIDNIVGSLDIFDQSGNYVSGVALTNWVPGDIYLPAGGSVPAVKSLALEQPDKRAMMIDEAENYTYLYTVLRIQFEGRAEVSYVEMPANKESEPEKMEGLNKESNGLVTNLADPEPCEETQITIETGNLYYPGPECSHVDRNINSERFKQEYIRLCQAEAHSASPPQSAARVQISSCMPDPSGVGIMYKKRICCDRL